MLKRFAIAISAAILAAAILISPVTAQSPGATSGTIGIGMAARPASGGTPGLVGNGAMGFARLGRGHLSDRGSALLLYPYFYSDYAHDTEQAAPLQAIVVPAAAPAPVSPGPPTPALEPLLIEWQGDHFERISLSYKALDSGRMADDAQKPRVPSLARGSGPAGSAFGSLLPARKAVAQTARELPPAVLVFRDGHREEVSSYTIVTGTIYSKADYWTSGSWSKKIQIADLDVSATLKLNHERGLNFVLPASPNEVVTRP